MSSAAVIAKYCRAEASNFARVATPTAAVTALDAYPTAADYLDAVSKETKGKYNRAANKARRAGYRAALTGRDAYSLSVHKIFASLKFRSHGAVQRAFQPIPEGIVDARTPFAEPVCPEHWFAEFGLFKERGDGESKAFALLQRCGNYVVVLNMIAHAEVLDLGGMKLLQFEIMDWLLKRQAPMVSGLRYLLHGGIEEGHVGLADWRRYVRQCPTLLRYALPEEAKFPADFNPRRYLNLHPDVRAAGANPRDHYVSHGVFQGFGY